MGDSGICIIEVQSLVQQWISLTCERSRDMDSTLRRGLLGVQPHLVVTITFEAHAIG